MSIVTEVASAGSWSIDKDERRDYSVPVKCDRGYVTARFHGASNSAKEMPEARANAAVAILAPKILAVLIEAYTDLMARDRSSARATVWATLFDLNATSLDARTPGAWRVSKTLANGTAAIVENEDGQRVAVTFSSPSCNIKYSDLWAEAEANAVLIAAGPSLLAALKATHQFLSEDNDEAAKAELERAIARCEIVKKQY